MSSKKQQNKLVNQYINSIQSLCSERIIQKKKTEGTYLPLQCRIDHINQSKRERIEQIQLAKLQDEALLNVTFTPHTNNTNPKRTMNQFHRDMNEWNTKKERKVENMRSEIKMKEQENLTFNPTLDVKSREMVKTSRNTVVVSPTPPVQVQESIVMSQILQTESTTESEYRVNLDNYIFIHKLLSKY